MEYLSQKGSKVPIYNFLPPFGNKYNMVFTIPSGVRETLVVSHRFSSKFLGRNSKVVDTEASVKPIRVPPTQPGIYLMIN